MQTQILKTIAIAGASSLLLTGCAVEYLNPDGACAELTSGQHPELFVDLLGEDADLYFEVQSEGSYDAMYAYVASPVTADFIEVSSNVEDVEDEFLEFFESLDDDTVALDRWNTSYDVSGSNPHRVSLGDGQEAAILMELGMALPVGVVSVCNDSAYVASLPTSEPTSGPESLVEVNLPDSDAKVFYPGYAPEDFVVELPGGSSLNVELDASDVVYMAAMILPWVGEFGDMDDASFAQRWYAAAYGLDALYMSSDFEGLSVVMADGDVSSNETFNLDPDLVNFDAFSELVATTDGYSSMENNELLGAVVITLAANVIDEDTYQVRFSYEVAEFGADGTFGAVGAGGGASTDYAGPKYVDDVLKGKPGDLITLSGTDMLVNSVRIGGQNARIVSNTATSLTIEIPAGLAGGKYDVQYTFDGGEVNRQLGAHVIGHSVWTKRMSDTQAKLYAKNVAGAGKVQLMLNGKEVAWVDAIDSNDPKLRKANGAHYLVRTVNLNSGKNVLEVWVDGTRERRTVYTR